MHLVTKGMKVFLWESKILNLWPENIPDLNLIEHL